VGQDNSFCGLPGACNAGRPLRGLGQATKNDVLPHCSHARPIIGHGRLSNLLVFNTPKKRAANRWPQAPLKFLFAA
jgi:hypothetical protein